MTDDLSQSERSTSIEVKWVPTDPHFALPSHHWQGTVTVDGEIAIQRRYFKKYLALHDCAAWTDGRSRDAANHLARAHGSDAVRGPGTK